MKNPIKKSASESKKNSVKKVAVKKMPVKKQAIKKTVVKKASNTVKTKEDNSFETKSKQVARHLIEKGSITSWEAIKTYRATRLSAIIFDLKKIGFIIETVMERNDKSNFGRYHYKGIKKTLK